MRRGLACLVVVLAGLAPAAARAAGFGGLVRDVPSGTHVSSPPPLAYAANLPYQGGEVLHSNRTHLVFWQPAGSGLSYDPGYQSLIETFLADVAADSHLPSNVYGLSGQYRDETGAAEYASRYDGAVLDTDPLPPNGCQEEPPPPTGTGPGWSVCLTDGQLDGELQTVIARYGLPVSGRDIYFLVTPDGLGSCEDSFGPPGCALGGADDPDGYCGYHTSDGSLLYAVIPYGALTGHCQSDNPRPNGNTADLAISTISHEHNEAVTDPFGTAWVDGFGDEVGDLCIANYGPPLGGHGAAVYDELIHHHRWYLQEEWSNENGSCQPRARPDSVRVKPPWRITAGKAAKLTALAHAAYGTIVHYNWTFGDGHTGSGRLPTHSYRRAGRYEVTLRTTDSAGNWASASVWVRAVPAPKPKRKG